jgi:hypothetical protein
MPTANISYSLSTHKTHLVNYNLIRQVPTSQVAWSLFCASNMSPRTCSIDYTPEPGISTSSLDIAAEEPPSWSNALHGIPLIGPHLNVITQVHRYFSPLEDCADFIAEDLRVGLESQWIGKRVGVKAKVGGLVWQISRP